MEYEKIILNLIERVSILEEKIAELEGNKKIEPKPILDGGFGVFSEDTDYNLVAYREGVDSLML